MNDPLKDLVTVLLVLGYLAFYGTVGYVIVHFVLKYW